MLSLLGLLQGAGMDMTANFSLFDGLGSLSLILAHGDISTQCQLFMVGVHGNLSHKQPPRAMFISPYSHGTSSDRLARLALGAAWDWGVGQMLATSRAFGIVGRGGESMTWMMVGTFSGMTAHRDAYEEVAIGSGMVKSIPFRPSWSSALVEGRAPKATDGGSLLGMLCWQMGLRLQGKSAAAIPKPPEGTGWGLWQCHAEVQWPEKGVVWVWYW